MSGFAGYTNFTYKRENTEFIIKQMIDAIIERGTDIEAYYDDLYTHIGYRCMSVTNIDIKKKAMYLKQNDKEYMIAFDGVLYNKEQLIEETKIELDTDENEELILKLYDKYGDTFVEKIIGFFSFVIWCKDEKKLYLARDMLGIKPLFYSVMDNNFIYGSEIKSILKFPNAGACLTTYGITNIFLKGVLQIKKKNFLKDINELNPGEYLVYTPDGIKKNKYNSSYIKMIKAPIIKTIDRDVFLTKDDIINIVKIKDIPDRITEDVMLVKKCEKIRETFETRKLLDVNNKWNSNFEIRCKLISECYRNDFIELYNFAKKDKIAYRDFSSIDRISNRYKYNLILPQIQHTINEKEIREMYSEIIESNDSPILMLLDRKNAISICEQIDMDTVSYLIEVNEWLKLYNINIV